MFGDILQHDFGLFWVIDTINILYVFTDTSVIIYIYLQHTLGAVGARISSTAHLSITCLITRVFDSPVNRWMCLLVLEHTHYDLDKPVTVRSMQKVYTTFLSLSRQTS